MHRAAEADAPGAAGLRGTSQFAIVVPGPTRPDVLAARGAPQAPYLAASTPLPAPLLPVVEVERSSPRAQTPNIQDEPPALQAEVLWSAVDEMTDPTREGSSRDAAVPLAAAGLIASTGYVLLNTRTGLWLLSLMTSRPLWKDFDPLEVLFAWEEESDGKEEETDESLVSIVG
jgi:hypothetical protein